MRIQHPLHVRNRVVNRHDHRVMFTAQDINTNVPSHRHMSRTLEVFQSCNQFPYLRLLYNSLTTTLQIRNRNLHFHPLHVRHCQHTRHNNRVVLVFANRIHNPLQRRMTITDEHFKGTHDTSSNSHLYKSTTTALHIRHRTNRIRQVHMSNQITTSSPRFHSTIFRISHNRTSRKFQGLTVIIITILTNP